MTALPKFESCLSQHSENVFCISEDRTLNWCIFIKWFYAENIYVGVTLIWGDFLSIRSAGVSRESKFSPDTKGTTYTHMSCEYMSCEGELSYLHFHPQQACSWSYYLRLNSLLAVTWDNGNWQICGKNIDILIWRWKKKFKLPATHVSLAGLTAQNMINFLLRTQKQSTMAFQGITSVVI